MVLAGALAFVLWGLGTAGVPARLPDGASPIRIGPAAVALIGIGGGLAAAVASAPIMGLAEAIVPSLGLLRFDRGQVAMAQEDSVCDHTVAEQAFGMQMRSFEDELANYADRIGTS